MHRLTFILLSGLLTLGGAAPGLPADAPNVLFIAVDDLNDWIGCLGGHPQTQTPNIDRLARRGMLFRNCHCAAPACNPSRAALMTGIRPSNSGVYLNPQPWRPALPEAQTIPQHLRTNGYTVFGSGKIYHGAYPDPASWDRYYPSLKQQSPPGAPKPVQRALPNTSHFDWGKVQAKDEEMSDTQVANWVIRQLGKTYKKPFFLACGIYRPHLPWYVPEKYFKPFPQSDIQLPEVPDDDLEDVPTPGKKMARPQGDHARVLLHKQWGHAVQSYLASVHFADTQIGRVLDALDASAHKDNTLIVFWTDHGWHLGEKKHWRKFALWERATRTPMIIVAPEARAGGVCDAPVNLIDLYPTISELCGLPARKGIDGQSLVPLLRNPNQKWERPSLTTHGRNNHALRDARYRYIQYEDGSEELYDHQQDPDEWTNLADKPEMASVKARLKKWLPTYNAENADFDKKKKKKK